jgi:hypothetical protein
MYRNELRTTLSRSHVGEAGGWYAWSAERCKVGGSVVPPRQGAHALQLRCSFVSGALFARVNSDLYANTVYALCRSSLGRRSACAQNVLQLQCRPASESHDQVTRPVEWGEEETGLRILEGPAVKFLPKTSKVR